MLGYKGNVLTHTGQRGVVFCPLGKPKGVQETSEQVGHLPGGLRKLGRAKPNKSNCAWMKNNCRKIIRKIIGMCLVPR